MVHGGPAHPPEAGRWHRADQTRWHEDDLAGRLLERQPDAWKVLRLPAEAEADDPLGRAPGELLWGDDDYGYAAELRRAREEIGERDWAALYQQSPSPPGGSIFKTHLMPTLEAPPAGLRPVRAWDLAATAEAGSRDADYTAGVLFARTPEGRFVVLDVVRLRGGPDEVEAAILATAARDGRSVPVLLPQDPGQAGKQQVAYLTRRLVGHIVRSSPETGKKDTRAMPVAAQVNVGNVALVQGHWNHAFLDELAAFPNGRHDDMVDALSRAFAEVGSASSVLDRFRALAS
jgi:predicted phage terminase large subunit-like protein